MGPGSGGACQCQPGSSPLESEYPSAQYDLSGARVALLLAVIRGRSGAQHDVEALRGLCQALGFETTLTTDPTAQAFQEELAQFREWLDAHRGPVSCALVALMAHGGPQGQLLGADGQEVQPEALVRELSCCRALRGRPKIFLLQACRGGESSRSLPHSLPAPRGPVCLTPTSTTNRPLGNWKAAGRCPSLIPRPWSPGLGCVAYRDETGSDFIQTLVEVLRADPEGDLLELLTEVCWGLGSGNRGRRAGCILLPGPGVLITCYSPGWGGSDPPPSAVRDGRTHNTHTGQVRWTAVISLINPQLGKDYISYV
uniref:Caspase family p20 domain-containing protein n=1 Tax=Equus asinus asinus TaxID=83772 RepID=A0A8C4LBV2_EQUAS